MFHLLLSEGLTGKGMNIYKNSMKIVLTLSSLQHVGIASVSVLLTQIIRRTSAWFSACVTALNYSEL